MRIVCLMGKSGTQKDKVKNLLMKLGYNGLISYTTRKPKSGEKHGVDYYFVTKEEFMRLVEKDIIMEWVEIDGEYYGSPHPIGSRNNVVVVDPEGYKVIKSIYKLQVIGVYLDKGEDTYDKVNTLNTMKFGYTDSNVINLNIMRNTEYYKYRGIEGIVDIVISNSFDAETITAKILDYISKHKKSKIVL